MPVNADDIVAIIVKETGIAAERLRPDVGLATLDIESIDMVSVIFAVEDRYAISISEDEVTAAETLQQFVDLVAAKAATV